MGILDERRHDFSRSRTRPEVIIRLGGGGWRRLTLLLLAALRCLDITITNHHHSTCLSAWWSATNCCRSMCRRIPGLIDPHLFCRRVTQEASYLLPLLYAFRHMQLYEDPFFPCRSSAGVILPPSPFSPRGVVSMLRSHTIVRGRP